MARVFMIFPQGLLTVPDQADENIFQ